MVRRPPAGFSALLFKMHNNLDKFCFPVYIMIISCAKADGYVFGNIPGAAGVRPGG